MKKSANHHDASSCGILLTSYLHTGVCIKQFHLFSFLTLMMISHICFHTITIIVCDYKRYKIKSSGKHLLKIKIKLIFKNNINAIYNTIWCKANVVESKCKNTSREVLKFDFFFRFYFLFLFLFSFFVNHQPVMVRIALSHWIMFFWIELPTDQQ